MAEYAHFLNADKVTECEKITITCDIKMNIF